MRRSASEIIHNLEIRLAQLEKKAGSISVAVREWNEAKNKWSSKGRHNMTMAEIKKANKGGDYEINYSEKTLQLTNKDEDQMIIVQLSTFIANCL